MEQRGRQASKTLLLLQTTIKTSCLTQKLPEHSVGRR